MFKQLATTLVLVAVVVGSLSAEAKNGGIARQIAMGGSQAGSGLVLNPFIMDDPALLLLNPAYQAMYKDYAWMNVGGGTLNGLSTANNGYGQQNAGVAFAMGREWAFGAILSYDPSAANSIGSLISPTGRTAQTIPAIQNVWEVVAAYQMSSTMSLGFGFTYGTSKHEDDSSGAASSRNSLASASMLGFRAGTVVDLGSGSSFDLSAALRLDKATDEMSTNTVKFGNYSASATEIQFQARGKFKMSNRFNFVPYGVLGLVSAEPKEDEVPTGGTAQTGSLKVSALAFAVGVGGEYRTPSFYLAGGLSFQSAKLKQEFSAPGSSNTSTMTATGIPVFNLGMEWWLTDWLAGRAGYYRASATISQKAESTPNGATTEITNSFVNSAMFVGGINPSTHDGLVTLGLGFRFGGFALDATVSEEALRRGLGLIGGGNDNINTFGYITTSYNFGE
jgi:hypothetical protein